MKTILLASLPLVLAAAVPAHSQSTHTTTTTTSRTTVTHHPAHPAKKTVVTHEKTVTRDAKGREVVRRTTSQMTETRLHHPVHHTGTLLAASPHRHPRAVVVAHTRLPNHAPLHVAAAPKPAAPAVPAPAPVASAPPPVDPNKGTATGLPLPRFAALRSDAVSFRSGPGSRYPIDWIYQRRDLPVKIEREFEVWRLVSEPDGTKGWVHQAMLTGRRGFLIDGDQPQTMRDSPAETAQPVAILKPGVVGQLLSCAAASHWCQIEVKSYKGYVARSAFWGTLPGETVSQ